MTRSERTSRTKRWREFLFSGLNAVYLSLIYALPTAAAGLLMSDRGVVKLLAAPVV